MSKLVFGLDLGSNSIGWAVVHEGTDPLKDPSKVISLGVRAIHFDTFVKSDVLTKNIFPYSPIDLPVSTIYPSLFMTCESFAYTPITTTDE